MSWKRLITVRQITTVREALAILAKSAPSNKSLKLVEDLAAAFENTKGVEGGT